MITVLHVHLQVSLAAAFRRRLTLIDNLLYIFTGKPTYKPVQVVCKLIARQADI